MEKLNPDEYCSKIKLEDGRNLYFSIKEHQGVGKKCLWCLILTDGNKIWSTEVSDDDLGDLAAGSSYSTEQFINLFKTAFNLRPQEPGTTLKYTLKELSAGRDCFFWSIFLPQNNKTFRLGSLNISPLPEDERAPVYCRMFDSLLSVSSQCRDEALSAKVQSEEERSVSKIALQKLEKLVTVQEECEQVLYTNFVAVINEKKRKIRELQDQCDAYQQRLNEHRETIPEDVPTTSTASTSTSKRGKAAKAPAKRSYKPVSACTAPAKSQQGHRGRNRKAVDYDSSDSETQGDKQQTQSDIAPSTSANRSRQRVESSDGDSTEIDEPQAEDEPRTHPPARQSKEAMIAKSSPDGIEPTVESTSEGKANAEVSGKEPLPCSPLPVRFSAAKATKPPPPASNKRSIDEELDDLLGEEAKPSSSGDKKQPIKRVQRRTTKAVSTPPPPSRAKAPRRAAASGAGKDSEELLDGLLDEL